MNRLEFITLLKSELEKYHVANIPDILADYEEHFQHGIAKSKTENDIAASLGSPLTIAKAYQTDNMINEVRQTSESFQWGLALKILARLLILAPFNFLIFFIPGLILLSLLFAGWMSALAVAGSSLVIFSFLPGVVSLATSFWIGLGGLTAGLATLCLGLFGIMIMFLISKYIILGLINYLQWNLQFILQSNQNSSEK